MAKFLPSILTSISKKPPSATSNIKLIFVPCFTLSKKHSSAWASTCKITYNGILGYLVCFELSTARNWFGYRFELTEFFWWRVLDIFSKQFLLNSFSGKFINLISIFLSVKCHNIVERIKKKSVDLLAIIITEKQRK